MKPSSLILSVAALGLLAQPSSADDAAELGLAYAEAQQKNLDQMKQYHWKTHTTMKSGEETKFDFTVANHLNEEGKMVQEVEDAESTVKKKRGVRGRKQMQAVTEVDALLEQIMTVMGSYIFMSKGDEVDFFDKAKITDGEGDLKGARVVTATDVSVKGDTLVKSIDPKTYGPMKIEFQFPVDAHSIEGEVMYRAIEDGPNVPRLSTIRILDMNATIETEFLDYTKQL